MRRIAARLIASGTVLAALFFYPGNRMLRAASSAGAALAGQVSSQSEGAMEGVLVSAKREGSNMTVTVVSDRDGRYSFPSERLQAGRHLLRIRAVGYDLMDPGPVVVKPGKSTQVDLKLQKTKDLAAQLSNSEWLLSIPGTKEQKMDLYRCAVCHSLERIVRSSFTVDEFEKVIARMNYYVGSTPLKPQRRPAAPPEERARQQRESREREQRFLAAGGKLSLVSGHEGPDMRNEMAMGDPGGAQRRVLAEYLSSINLSKGPVWSYQLKTMTRPSGRGTRVIYTTYELPRKNTMVHDADYGPDGMVWYTDFGSQFFGMLDPKTGKVSEYPVPILRPGFPEGLMDIRFDRDSNVWMGMMAQGAIAKFDRKTGKLKTYKTPAPADVHGVQVAMVMPYSSHVDGKVWSNNVGLRGIQRLDVKTGKIETIRPYDSYTKDPRSHGTYGINADAENNLYVNDITSNIIVRIDAKTLKSTFFETPTPHSGPRRARMDSQYRLWIAESTADKIAMLDPATGRFTEYPAPTPFTQIYDVMPDKKGDVWAGGMTSDRVYRLNPKTGWFDQYLLPKVDTNIRRVDVDDTSELPIFWVGDDHSPTIYRVEALD